MCLGLSSDEPRCTCGGLGHLPSHTQGAGYSSFLFMRQIHRFDGEYRFLSNFWLSPIRFSETVVFPSAEHAYQGAKCSIPGSWRVFTDPNMTPGAAKKWGRQIIMRTDWDSVKLSIMHEILTIKFSNPELRKMLLSTWDAVLIEGNTWGDTYWGICNGKGTNHLGQLLMIIRKTINEQ